MKKRQVTAHSVNYYARLMLLLIIPILIINLLASFFVFTVTRKQNIQLLDSTTEVYITDLNQKLAAIDHFLVWSQVHEPALKKIRKSTTTTDFNEALKDWRARVNDFQYSTGPEFQFFLEDTITNKLINVSPLQVSYPAYKQLNQDVMKNYKDNKVTFGADSWKLRAVGENYFFFRTIAYEDITLHCIVSAKNILEPLTSIATGKTGYLALSDDNGTTVATDGKKITDVESATDIFHSRSILTAEQTTLPFTLEIYVDHFNAFRSLVTAQITLILVPLLILITAAVGILLTKRHILDPIQRFSTNLTKREKNNELLTYENSGIEELESVNDQFKQLVTEIKELKIDLYERQLAQQDVEMNHLKLQIKPHFYLNVLTTINSMIATEHYLEAEQMTLVTTEYFRYLFQSNSDFVQLKDELIHIDNFLAIQKIRYNDAFDYQLTIDEGLDACLIPPLVLQTLVENTIKHSLSFRGQSIIKLKLTYIDEKKEWIQIIYTDNGTGFPPDVLTKLQQHISLTTSDGKHIGLSNITQRLTLLYAENHAIRFLNQAEGGVKIELVLPFITD